MISRSRSGVSCSGMKGFQVDSVSHRIEDDVDAKRIRFFDGELFEVPGILPFALPSVAQVRVVTNDRHHAPAVVEDAAPVVADATPEPVAPVVVEPVAVAPPVAAPPPPVEPTPAPAPEPVVAKPEEPAKPKRRGWWSLGGSK